jgi:hypothetical protein
MKTNRSWMKYSPYKNEQYTGGLLTLEKQMIVEWAPHCTKTNQSLRDLRLQ